jgi:L-iditol 2-dehydrogenase
MSSPGEPGFFREYANLPASNLLALPPNMGVDVGSLIEPLAVALHSLELGKPKLGETAAVFGAGPIGLLTIAALKLSGVSRIWAVEPLPARRELALLMGADAVFDPAAVDIARPVDVAFDCATKGRSVAQAIQVVRRAGRVVITGIPAESETPVEFHVWRRKELAILQVRRSNHEAPLAREILARDPGRFAPLITHSRPLEEIDRAFAQVERYDDGVGKLIVRLG